MRERLRACCWQEVWNRNVLVEVEKACLAETTDVHAASGDIGVLRA
jgi:hypothetical protein